MNKLDFDWKPLALVPLLALLVLPFIGSPSTWVTLTVAGLAMGMIIFIIASGLTLVFGLMDVLNFGHGVFIALGAFVATSVLGAMGDYTASGSLWLNLMAVLPAMVVAMLVAGGRRPGLRALHRAPGVRQPPQADPDHHGRDDHRRGADQGHLGPAADPVAAARGHARLHPARRRRRREVPPDRRGGGHRGLRRAAVDADPHQDRPADARRRAGPRDGGVAGLSHQACCSSACSWSAARWPAWAA